MQDGTPLNNLFFDHDIGYWSAQNLPAPENLQHDRLLEGAKTCDTQQTSTIMYNFDHQ